jgi:23S rRNA (cytosine1962-C5)-methyltransferase
MKYFNRSKPIKLKLTRDLSKHLKQGNPWIFSDALEKITAPEGSYACLANHKNEILAYGFFSSKVNLSFRAVTFSDQLISDEMIHSRLNHSLKNRTHLLHEKNQSLRLINGEGDELPGIIADYYNGIVVLKFDGEASMAFWNKEALSNFFMEQKEFPTRCVYLKKKNTEQIKGEILAGDGSQLKEAEFLENEVKFKSNIIDAAKTGFFLDQRENRNFIRSVSKNKSLLNLFGYTGGFSIYAGLGGANSVTTVDIAPEAIKASEINWSLNLLPEKIHQAVCEDAFSFVAKAVDEKKNWDIVICDPPSFAPNKKAVHSATDAYVKIFSDSLKLVKKGGFFAASSCSGHIDFEEFQIIVQASLSKTKRRGKVILIKGQPEDHPFPLALKELRYLKFIYLQIF